MRGGRGRRFPPLNKKQDAPSEGPTVLEGPRDQLGITLKFDAGCSFGSRCRSCGAAQRELRLVSLIVACSPGLRLGLCHSLEFKIKRHGSADEVLQCRLIDLLVFVDVDGAPDISVEARVE